MKRMIGMGIVGLMLLACTSEADSDAACADIAGNYSVRSVPVSMSGTCDPSMSDGDENPATFTFSKASSDGAWDINFPGITGGCPGVLDASCRFVANCTISDPRSGNTLATISLDYVFAGKRFSGSSVAAIESCTATFKDDGQKL